ncbi:uncharacterized protein [Elaeis guineensis]|uniref:Uncharacterized protein LOC105049634 isoform X3 n=1 Tax=Elaeis guineensis var. tenera TaxID=51953 RepID=A0A6J0PMA6_ELAGV|nr:uncharacterized protein LOC105049634 isoform X3 [Elaeis guineensis]XP_029121796.1 uncharacterized protein LOC105049634 isoform X3 [Elaeis guineensis]
MRPDTHISHLKRAAYRLSFCQKKEKGCLSLEFSSSTTMAPSLPIFPLVSASAQHLSFDFTSSQPSANQIASSSEGKMPIIGGISSGWMTRHAHLLPTVLAATSRRSLPSPSSLSSPASAFPSNLPPVLSFPQISPKKRDADLLLALLAATSHRSPRSPSSPSSLASAFPSDLPQVLLFLEISEKRKEMKRKQKEKEKNRSIYAGKELSLSSRWQQILFFGHTSLLLDSCLSQVEARYMLKLLDSLDSLFSAQYFA